MWLETQRLFEYVDRWASGEAEENSADVLSRIGHFKDRILNITKNKVDISWIRLNFLFSRNQNRLMMC